MAHSRNLVYIICILALAESVLGQATDTQNVAYADTNVTVIGLSIKFRSEPRGRGTIGIILSCTATFLFCIWGTVHPNIVVGAKSYYRLFYKAILMLIAIVVPEGLILSAFAQYREANELHKLWLEKCREDEEYEDEPWYTFLKFWEDSKSTFGMECAFFVVMGGFVVKYSSSQGQEIEQPARTDEGQGTQQPAIIDHSQGREHLLTSNQSSNEDQATSTRRAQIEPHVILTSEGFKHYYRNFIDKKDMKRHRKAILDKGKASNMAKCLAGLQALWLIVQCFARWQAGLPVTLLEIHVAIQVVCTMIIFFCWWSKPLDVNDHIELTLRWKGGSAADMEGGEQNAEREENELRSRLKSLKTEEEKLAEGLKNNIAVNPKGQRFIRKYTPPDLTGITAKAFYDISSCLDNSATTGDSNRSVGSEETSGSDVNGGTDWKMHWMAMGAEASLVLLTGALHAAAWDFPFQTGSGRILWRISSVGMCACPTLAVGIASITAYQVDLATATWEIHLGDPRENTHKRHFLGFIKAIGIHLGRIADRHGRPMNEQVDPGRNEKKKAYMTTFHYFAIWVVLVLLVGYAASIITITIIAFLSMRHPPIGSFNTPRWNDYWPHF